MNNGGREVCRAIGDCSAGRIVPFRFERKIRSGCIKKETGDKKCF